MTFYDIIASMLVASLLVLWAIGSYSVAMFLRKRLFPKPVLTQPVPTLPIARTWTAVDRDWLKGMLFSPTGQKLLERLRATEYANATSNARDRVYADHAAGHSCGYGDCLKHLQSLTISCAPDEQGAKTDGGAPGEAPTAEREADEYRQRMSP